MEYSLIFGAGGGIGREFAKQLAKIGNNLILSSRSEEKLQLLKEELLKEFPTIKILYKSCDISCSDSRIEFFDYLKNLSVSLNGFYYVSGVDTQKAFVKYSEEKIINQIRVNFEGAISTTLECLKCKAPTYKILVVSSLTGITPMPYYSLYSATKSALISFFTSLRYELKGTGTKITILAPGSVPTRKDIILDIKKQGLQGKLSQKSPKYVVKRALRANEKNKRLCVPGFYNKLVMFFSFITPNFIKLKVISKKFKNKEKDAF